MTALRVLDLFSGIGGMALGLERAGHRIVAFCESAPFPRCILARHWPEVPIIPDVRSIAAAADVDMIAGGFPCQPFSHAASGRNLAEKNLWPEMRRVIALCRPKFVLGENVSERAVSAAGRDLAAIGYTITTRRISGADCGAPHRRNRWWLVAHPHDQGEFRGALNAEVGKLPALCRSLWTAETYADAIRVPDGVPGGLDEARLMALGNAVIPAIPQAIGRAISAVQWRGAA